MAELPEIRVVGGFAVGMEKWYNTARFSENKGVRLK